MNFGDLPGNFRSDFYHQKIGNTKIGNSYASFFLQSFQLSKLEVFPSTKRLLVAFILGRVILAVRHDSGSR